MRWPWKRKPSVILEVDPPHLNIFLSYRRDDASTYAARLYDSLSDRFGQKRVFMDIDSLEIGKDYAVAIKETVARCDVLLALIGLYWLTAADDEGNRRLENPEDLVRLEVESALARNVRVVPVLVDDARMPKGEQLPGELVGLIRRTGIKLASGRGAADSWAADVSALIERLDRVAIEIGSERYLENLEREQRVTKRPKPARWE